MAKKDSIKSGDDKEESHYTTEPPLQSLDEKGRVATSDFTPSEIEELRRALHNSEYMIRKRLRQARDHLLGRGRADS